MSEPSTSGAHGGAVDDFYRPASRRSNRPGSSRSVRSAASVTGLKKSVKQASANAWYEGMPSTAPPNVEIARAAMLSTRGVFREDDTSMPKADIHEGTDVMDILWGTVKQEMVRSHQRSDHALQMAGEYTRIFNAAQNVQEDLTSAADELLHNAAHLVGKTEANVTARRQLKQGQRELTQRRKAMWDKRDKDHRLLRKLHANEAWKVAKWNKYDLEKVAANLDSQLLRLGMATTKERRKMHDDRERIAQEEARLRWEVTAAQEYVDKLDAAIEHERNCCDRLARIETADGAAFGAFVVDGRVLEGLPTLRLDIEALHLLPTETRMYTLECLSRRYDQLRELTGHLRGLLDATGDFGASLDVSDTMDWMNAKTADVFSAGQARVLLYGDHEAFLWCKVGTQGDEEDEEEARFRPDVGLTAKCLKQRSIILSNDPEREPEYDERVDRLPNQRTASVMMAPLYDARTGAPIGLLQVFNKRSAEGNDFNDRDRFLFQTMTQQAGVALTNAQDFEAERNKEYVNKAMLRDAAAFSNEPGVLAVVHIVRARCRKLVGGQRCHAYFWNPHDQALQNEPFFYTPQAKAHPTAPPYIPKHIQLVAEDQTSRVLVDAYAEASDTIQLQESDKAKSFRACRVVAVPMMTTGGKLIGVLEVAKGWRLGEEVDEGNLWMNDVLDPFTPEQVAALELICAQAATVIENAQIFDRLRAPPNLLKHHHPGIGLRECIAIVLAEAQVSMHCGGARMLFPLAGHDHVWAYDPGTDEIARLRASWPIAAALVAAKITVLAEPLPAGAPGSARNSGRRKGLQVMRTTTSALDPRRADRIGADPVEKLGRPPALDDELREQLQIPGHDNSGECQVLVPLFDPATMQKPIGVLQLSGKVHGLPFDRVDTFVLQPFSTAVAVYLQAGMTADELRAREKVTQATLDLYDALGAWVGTADPRKDKGFATAISEAAQPALEGTESVSVFWRGEGFGNTELTPADGGTALPEGHAARHLLLQDTITATHAGAIPRPTARISTTGDFDGSGAGTTAIHAAIACGESTYGVLEVRATAADREQLMLGPWEHQQHEADAIIDIAALIAQALDAAGLESVLRAAPTSSAARGRSRRKSRPSSVAVSAEPSAQDGGLLGMGL